MTSETMMGVKTLRCWTGGGPRNEVWNWGDAISPTLFAKVSGCAPELVDYTDMSPDPHLMICGSTMKWITPGSILWGIGEISQSMAFLQPDVRPAHVAAVRGPLTRARLLERGIDCPEIYCDPALLFPRFYAPAPAARRYRLGIIPHYIDRDLPALARFRAEADVRVIDITQSALDGDARIFGFVDDVCSCDAILSSSLHGLILADAYGIPSRWMQLSDRVFGGDFKFRDYFASMEQAARAEAPLRALEPSVETLIAQARADFDGLGPVRPDLQAFLAAFPGPSARTDVERWARVAASPPPWDARNQRIAKHIPPGSSVVEFGSGNQSLRRHLALGAYQPVDCVPGEGDVFLCDYNRETRFPRVSADVIVMSGFLEYIIDTEAFLRALKAAYPGTRCLFSWAFEPHEPAARAAHGWIAGLNPASEAEAPFSRIFSRLRPLDVHQTPLTRQVIYEGVL
ncbi:polysaccharide pyruvyl transferase family protein [Rhodobacter maris]|uniref:Polysaccharide pyruvyl transferase n=1 Tax=Rhodobacter maris TaxID=446682 RepID=A0A285SG65_9RHOB|nr:polysaccharide pyruvyl transferase family protein [Rhodobacter maris]SOC06884.1 polysaccharide pyruvyl transferase [Rhodobacter maris]